MRIPKIVLTVLFLAVPALAAAAGIPWDAGHVRLERDVVYGGEDSPEEEMLFLPIDFAVDGEGNVVVSDYKLHCLMVYEASGMLLRTVGAEGEGPGDFRSPVSLVRAPDGDLIVFDEGNRRIQRVTAEGEYVAAADVSFPDRLTSLAMTPAGGLYATLFVGTLGPSRDPTTIALVHLGDDLGVVARLDSMAVRTQAVVVHGNGYWVTSAPYFPTLEWAPLPDGRFVVGHGDSPAIRIIDASGATRTTFTLEGEAAPVTEADRERFLGRYVRDGEDTLTPEQHDAIVFPDRMPWFLDILVDDDGTILVRRDRGEGEDGAFDAYDSDGHRLARFTTDPLPSRVRFRRGAIYAVYYPGDELPSVVRWVAVGGSE